MAHESHRPFSVSARSPSFFRNVLDQPHPSPQCWQMRVRLFTPPPALGFFSLTLACFGLGCEEPPTPPISFREPTSQQKQKMGALGIQRVIPLRITVLTKSCSSTTDCLQPAANPPDPNSVCNVFSQTCMANDPLNAVQSVDPVTYEAASMAVARANSIFAPAGIHFYLSRMEKIVANDFADLRRRNAVGDFEVTWSSIWPQIQAIFPSANSTS